MLPMSMELREMGFKSIESFRRESVTGSPSPESSASEGVYSRPREGCVDVMLRPLLALWSKDSASPSPPRDGGLSLVQQEHVLCRLCRARSDSALKLCGLFSWHLWC